MSMNKKFISIFDQAIIDLNVISGIEITDDCDITFYNIDGDRYAYWQFKSTFIRDKIFKYLQLKYSTLININDIEGLDKLSAEDLFEIL